LETSDRGELAFLNSGGRKDGFQGRKDLLENVGRGELKPGKALNGSEGRSALSQEKVSSDGGSEPDDGGEDSSLRGEEKEGQGLY